MKNKTRMDKKEQFLIDQTTQHKNDYSRLFEKPPHSWDQKSHPIQQSGFKHKLLVVLTTVAVVIGTVSVPAVLEKNGSANTNISSEQLRIQVTSFSYDKETKVFHVKGEVSAPKETVLGYEIRPQQGDSEQKTYWVGRAAFQTKEDNKFEIAIPTNNLPQSELYTVNIALDPQWQNDNWPAEEILGKNQERMVGPEVRSKNSRKQLATQVILYTKQYF